MVCTQNILGAGIAGLTLGIKLKNATIFEKTDAVGGRLSTVNFDKTPVDTGAQYISNEDVASRNLITQMKLNKELKPFDLTKFIILSSKHEFNERVISDIFTDKSNEINRFYQYVSTANEQELANVTGNKKDTFASWYNKKFGGEMHWLIDEIIRMNALTDSNHVSIEYGLAITNVFLKGAQTLKCGMSTLVKNILTTTRANNTKIALRTEAQYFDCDSNNQVRSITFNNMKMPQYQCRVISAIPAPELAILCADNYDFSKQLKKISYASCRVITIAVEDNKISKNIGSIIVGKKISTIINNSKKVNSSSSKQILTITVPQMPSSKQYDAILSEFSDIYSINPNKINFLHQRNWINAIPICSPELKNIRQKLLEIKPINLELAGDFMGLPSIEGALESTSRIN